MSEGIINPSTLALPSVVYFNNNNVISIFDFWDIFSSGFTMKLSQYKVCMACAALPYLCLQVSFFQHIFCFTLAAFLFYYLFLAGSWICFVAFP